VNNCDLGAAIVRHRIPATSSSQAALNHASIASTVIYARLDETRLPAAVGAQQELGALTCGHAVQQRRFSRVSWCRRAS
jgi:hypothetical protein